MGELLDLAIDAHGGWDRWQRVSKFTARATLGGTLWRLKGHPDANDVRVAAELHTQHLEYRAPDGRRGIYEPERTTIALDDDGVVESLVYPRTSFAGHTHTTPWNDLQLLYFRGYAMWNYLTSPFSFREQPGFESQEIEPWAENGETWRRLRVTFPPHVHSHSPRQTFYFDAGGLLRRQDYSVDIVGGTTTAHYVTEHRNIGGIVFATRRRVYASGPDNRPFLDRIAVAIDLHDIAVE